MGAEECWQWAPGLLARAETAGKVCLWRVDRPALSRRRGFSTVRASRSCCGQVQRLGAWLRH